MARPPKAKPAVLAVAANDAVPVFQSLAVAEMSGEPRIRDLDLAERLGFDRPRKIRELIERNKPEILDLGTCPTVGRVARGNQVDEYYLNEEQALLVALLSDTPAARLVRVMLIKTFSAYRRMVEDQPGGLMDSEQRKVVGGIVKSVMTNQLQVLLPQLVQAEIVANQYVGVRGLTAGEVLDMAGFTDRKGLRNLAGFVSGRLRPYHAARHTVAPQAQLGRTTAYIFDRALAREWLDTGGRQSVEMKIAEKRGQTVMKLVRKTD